MGDAAIHVYSPAAAPRILRALPAQLSPSRLAAGASVTAVSAAVDLHNLLCETSDPADAPSRAEADVVRAHAAALDDYVAHVESLAESSRPDPSKRAAAILLGQLCRDCAPRRFVTSLARWAAALVALVKPDKDALPTPVARGAARAVRHLLDRAASMMDVPGVRKEAATVAQRAATTAARWLDDVGIDDPSLAADALALIRAALHGHPAALRPRVDALERTLVETMCLAVDPGVVAAAVECVVATPRAGAVAGSSAAKAPSPTPPPRGAPSRDESPSPRTMFSTSHFAARNRRTRPRPRARRYSRPERPKLRRLSAATRTPPSRASTARARCFARRVCWSVSPRFSARLFRTPPSPSPRMWCWRSRRARRVPRRRRRRVARRPDYLRWRFPPRRSRRSPRYTSPPRISRRRSCDAAEGRSRDSRVRSRDASNRTYARAGN